MKIIFLPVIFLIITVSALAQNPNAPVAKMALFPLRDIRLLDGPVQRQQEINRQYLLKLEPDRLLSWFRREAELDPKAPPYRGWESEGRPLPGHILGFYLSGAAMTLQATGDAELRRRLDYIVDELAKIQNANQSGYMLAVPGGKQIFADIARGKIEIDGLPWTGYQINGNFEPTYTLNKLMLGLYQVWLATDNEKAKQVLIRLADWFGNDVLEKLNDQQVQTLLDCEHGSLNEGFVDVYRLTGDKKYLNWSRRLCHERMLAPLAAGDVKFLDHYHANTQIPKYTGFESLYDLNGETKLDAAAMNFWGEVVSNRSWVIGGNSAAEHFFPTNEWTRALHAAAGPESCNSVNMLRLTESLFPMHPSAALMNYYECTLFNHLLAVHDPEMGMFAYYTAMQPGSYRVYSDQFDSMWCCVGTGLEAPSKYGQMVYTHAADNSALDVNLFIASELNWRDKHVTVRQSTDFPHSEKTELQIACAQPTEFTLRIRHPWWVVKNGLQISVNGEVLPEKCDAENYAKIHRVWKDGDTVELRLPMRLMVQTLPGNDHYIALLYGPIVLSGELGREGMTSLDFWQIRDTVGRKTMPESKTPAFIAKTPDEVLEQIQPDGNQPLTFWATGVSQTNKVRLVPFYENHFQRYAIYWRRFSSDELRAEEKRSAETAEAKKKRDVGTVDQVQIGDEISEKKHNFQSLRSFDGIASYDTDLPTHWRDARDGGWFSYELKVAAGKPQILRCTYWGQEYGARTFDILVDGKAVKTTTLGDTGKTEFFNVDIPLDAKILESKKKITITLQAHPGNTAGGIFDLRILSAAK
jgi:DUF1680 family protein